MLRFLSGLAGAVLGLVLQAGVAVATPTSVAELLDAKVDYAADYYLNSDQGSFHGTMIHAPGRERREFDSRTGHQALLLRRDIDEATILWPERKWYLSTSFQSVAGLVGGFDGLMLDRKPAGRELVAGEATIRYEVAGSGGGQGRFKGLMWFTRDGILMKAAGRLTFNGRDTPVETGLLNLRRIKADPGAFVRPKDYAGLPLDLSKLGLH